MSGEAATVSSTDAPQQEGPGFNSLLGLRVFLCVLFMSSWVSTQSKNMNIAQLETFDLSKTKHNMNNLPHNEPSYLLPWNSLIQTCRCRDLFHFNGWKDWRAANNQIPLWARSTSEVMHLDDWEPYGYESFSQQLIWHLRQKPDMLAVAIIRSLAPLTWVSQQTPTMCYNDWNHTRTANHCDQASYPETERLFSKLSRICSIRCRLNMNGCLADTVDCWYNDKNERKKWPRIQNEIHTYKTPECQTSLVSL